MPKYSFSNIDFAIIYKDFLLRLKLKRRVHCVLSNIQVYLQVLPRENYYMERKA